MEVSLFDDVFAMNDEYEALRRRIGIASDTGGSCGVKTQVESSWVDAQNHPRGRVLCFDSNADDRWMIWTYDPALVLTKTWRNDLNRKALYAWWRSNAVLGG
jgi:hypothetical protein